MKFSVIIILLSSLLFSQTSKNQIAIDHIPVVVKNLKNAEVSFKKAGFTIKPGRLHKNGLLNSHIKFQDGTEIEIMSVKENKDKISNEYLRYLRESEGGTYLSLKIESINYFKKFFKKNNIKYSVLESKLFTYITFPHPSLKHIFLIKYKKLASDYKNYIEHRKNAQGIKSVSISGDKTTESLLKLLFEKSSFDKTHSKFILRDNRTIILNTEKKYKNFRVLSISLNNTELQLTLHGLEIK